jgi:hypothetical protein
MSNNKIADLKIENRMNKDRISRGEIQLQNKKWLNSSLTYGTNIKNRPVKHMLILTGRAIYSWNNICVV